MKNSKAICTSMLLMFTLAWTKRGQAEPPKPLNKPVEKAADTKITAINAHLFYTDSGTLSPHIIGKKEFLLWNTIIGEGDAGRPSHNTLVVVELTSPKRSDNFDFSVAATENNKLKGSVKLTSGYFTDSKLNVPLFLYETGCWPIKIEAKLGKQTVRKTIDFGCGE